MKKVLMNLVQLLLILSLVIGFFTGCSNVFSKDKEINGDKEEFTVIPKNLDEKTLTFYFFSGSSLPERPDFKLVRDEIEKCSNLNIRLDFQWFDYRTYISKVQTAFASNEPVDAFCCTKPNNDFFDFTAMAKKGELKDITDLFPKYAPNLCKKYSDVDLACARVDGKLFAVPQLYPTASGIYAVVRADFMEKYNIPDIKNYDDYGVYLKAVKENEKGIIPGFINTWTELDLFAKPFGFEILDRDKKLVYKQDDPEMNVIPWEETTGFKEMTNYITTWNNNNYLLTSYDNDYVGDPNKVSSIIYYGQIRPEGEFTQDYPKGIKPAKMRAYRLYPNNTIERDSLIGNDINSGGAIVFNANSKNTERALMFLNWIQQNQDNYELFMYGIQNKDYIIKDGMVTFPEGMDYEKSSYMYWDGYWNFRNIEYERFPEVQESENMFNNKKAYMDYIGTKTQYPRHEGFYPDYTAVQSQADERANAFSRKIDFDLTNLLAYTTSDRMDMIMQELKDNGANIIADVVQRQLTKWREENKK